MKNLAVATIAALVFVPTAAAAAPILLSVGDISRHPTATWSLPSGVESRVAEVATSPQTSSDGYFFNENVKAFDTLEPTQTSWTYNSQLDPGTAPTTSTLADSTRRVRVARFVSGRRSRPSSLRPLHRLHRRSGRSTRRIAGVALTSSRGRSSSPVVTATSRCSGSTGRAGRVKPRAASASITGMTASRCATEDTSTPEQVRA